MDLTGAILIGAHLFGANLVRANLTDANLFLADLTGANLFLANLTGVDLTGAILVGTDLTGITLNERHTDQPERDGRYLDQRRPYPHETKRNSRNAVSNAVHQRMSETVRHGGA